ncbi:ABC transporter permease [Actinomyces howellii]|uniref:ABC-type transport system involved in multi-copper enzyme maturation, permease component n=1 Tax=Actinomyces howellii TaxID=52771 RepID=A0A3S4RBM8_9ACTO|nr:ABC transporter permease subunit [Actinomyces howellii]VEG29083.1 ABC-type transport system involved in multi-copper enzyme maturation, permease component [Actinomyces howellii]
MSLTGIRTVMVLELRQRVRSTRWQVMLAIWGIVLTIVCGGLATLSSGFGTTLTEVTPMLYDLVVCFVLGIGLIVAPTLSATSINSDRADATLALLQATALRPVEIAVGKLAAAWAAATTFLGVALPFLLVLTLLRGASWAAFLAHLLILVVSLGAVCAVGLGFSAVCARTSSSAVLTYLVVAALSIGSPLLMIISALAITTPQTEIVYEIDDYSASPPTCTTTPTQTTHHVQRPDLVWWMLTPNPFVAVADVSGRAPFPVDRSDPDDASALSLLSGVGQFVDEIRTPEPSTVIINRCEDADSVSASNEEWENMDYLAFWPASLLLLVALGAGGTAAASRRLRTPAGALPRGIRLA